MGSRSFNFFVLYSLVYSDIETCLNKKFHYVEILYGVTKRDVRSGYEPSRVLLPVVSKCFVMEVSRVSTTLGHLSFHHLKVTSHRDPVIPVEIV